MTGNFMTMQSTSSLFGSAVRRGFWQRLKRRLKKRPIHLKDFEEWHRTASVNSRYDCGIDTIPVEQIVGSLGRSTDFDHDFMPLSDSVEMRWCNLMQLYIDGITLPPIDVYLTDDGYYVIDGNHRVSISRFIGIEYVEAHVVRLDSESS